MNIEDIFSQIEKSDAEYDIYSSDFAITAEPAKNRLVNVRLMQRNTLYNDCILIGNETIDKDVRGIIIFVGKTKYPVFCPLFFANNSSTDQTDESTVRIQKTSSTKTSKSKSTGKINPSSYPDSLLTSTEVSKLSGCVADVILVYKMIKSKFPTGDYYIVSAKRSIAGTSQHNSGEAVDITCPAALGHTEDNPAPNCILDDIASYLATTLYGYTSAGKTGTYKISSSDLNTSSGRGQMFWRCLIDASKSSPTIARGGNHYNHLHFSAPKGSLISPPTSYVEVNSNGNVEFVCDNIV